MMPCFILFLNIAVNLKWGKAMFIFVGELAVTEDYIRCSEFHSLHLGAGNSHFSVYRELLRLSCSDKTSLGMEKSRHLQ